MLARTPSGVGELMTLRLCSLYRSPNSSILLTRASRRVTRAAAASSLLSTFEDAEDVDDAEGDEVGEWDLSGGPECGMRMYAVVLPSDGE